MPVEDPHGGHDVAVGVAAAGALVGATAAVVSVTGASEAPADAVVMTPAAEEGCEQDAAAAGDPGAVGTIAPARDAVAAQQFIQRKG